MKGHSPLPVFVYGTLLRGEPRHHLIAESAEDVVEAVMPGAVLHNLGPYPMLLPGPGRVMGELVTIRQDAYARVLAELDAIEGTRRGLYRRERRTAVMTGCGPVVEAWVYVGNTPIAEQYPIIASGDWRAREC